MKQPNYPTWGQNESTQTLVEFFTMLASKPIGPVRVNLDFTINQTSADMVVPPAPVPDAPACQNSVLLELLPIFWNNAAEARRFLSEVDGADSGTITSRVNQLIREEKVCKAQCKGDLWQILHDAKIYNCTVQNWNKYINLC